METSLIKYHSFMSFAFWFLPYQVKQKEVLVSSTTAQNIKIKSNVYEGTATKINKYLSYLYRYLFLVLAAVWLFPYIQADKHMMFFGLIIGMFTPLAMVNLDEFSAKKYVVGFGVAVAAVALIAAGILHGADFGAKTLAISIHYSFFFYLVYAFVLDFINFKNKDLYCVCDQKILFYKG
ncbi:MAG: hypothetical protein A2513_02765 [Sulfurimonas sp. RIFOXYD12_FULL_33_39]|uniref:hypothetical protein n=1 Tax=unclassified Sulfurimonas TaxID=2623549 RepID=UPI0008D739C6|nr:MULTISPECIES: hypothetical protein [unclassified Sulfurimonas]OHE08923.1 MAG: hypothetical protein A2513_02765 [Sulfurimonas sp. RIFOXYD12_FULL_33_39]OHE14233.1 MAG: hypothetical protein A2530_06065 [Sulfurimonas sp. RIFOXYD2_FULL_34_21]DAB27996.1 MAG TPA: hypothetical protein CFH78_04845 [Sulfurimonas sp. UBA10385]